MKRLTSNNVWEMNMTELALNQVYVEDGCAWYIKGPEDECRVCDLIRGAAKALDVGISPDLELDDDALEDVLLDWLQFGEEAPEGILAILYRALWTMAELRERLKEYEDICFGEDGVELLSPWVLQVLRDVRLTNAPLTQDELREMDGEPVWVESRVMSMASHWAIVREGLVNDGRFVSDKKRCLLSTGENGGYGIAWLAYRRKPEEAPKDAK